MPTPPQCCGVGGRSPGGEGEEAEVKSAAGANAHQHFSISRRRNSWRWAKACNSGSPAGFPDDDFELAELGLDLRPRQEGDTRRQDRRLDDGMLGAVEAEEIATRPVVQDLRFDGHAVLASRQLKSLEIRNSGTHPGENIPGYTSREPAPVAEELRPTAAFAKSSTSSVT